MPPCSVLRPAARSALLLAAAAALLLPSAPVAAVEAARLDRTLLDARITESSGLARSGYDDGLLWTHNDSGDGPRLFAVGPDGRTVATAVLRGASAVDWEALARYRGADRSYLYVGDVGDNARARREVAVHRVEEPRSPRGDLVLAPRTYRLAYEDGPRDAEALLVHPWTGRLYVVSKDYRGGAVYEAPAALSTTGVNVLRRVASAPALVTDGAVLFDGRVVLRDYVAAWVSPRIGAPATRVPLPASAQGESLAPAPGSRAVLVGSEGLRSPVHRQPLPG
ncbi:hypothetical protein [Vallicoccus soli]|uniref:Integral membrane protein n=1 Tax=Vallicoccus soli TaxID=2339232 RepID=A0A3A3Z7L6_9ACTN|nr:hypothetical protein [Vallicoccus soli]RJK97917.1 hypothetical protein D5H78_02820 [Vallicoccus soli]